MKMDKSRRMLAFVGLIVGGVFIGQASALAQEELVVNGSFEAPQLTHGTWHTFVSLPGWNLAQGPAIEIQNNVAGSPYAGRQFVELDSSSRSSIFQDISTQPERRYRLSLAFSPRPGTPLSDNILEIYWNGQYLDSVARPGDGLSDTQWTVLSYTVTATRWSTRLELRDAGVSNGLGSYVDEVSLRPE